MRHKWYNFLRDFLRYVRQYNEITHLKKKYPKGKFIAIRFHLGDAYILAGLGGFNGKIVLSQEKETLGMLKMFPEIIEVEHISRNLFQYVDGGCLGETLDFLSTDMRAGCPKNWVEAARLKLGLLPTAQFQMMHFEQSFEDEVRNKLANVSWQEGKSVLIVPESQTLQLPASFDEVWVKIAGWLVSKGFRVVFNSQRKYGEYPSLYLPIPETVCAVNHFGWVIGTRTGLLDVLAGMTNASIFAIYPQIEEKITTETVQIGNQQKLFHGIFEVPSSELSEGEWWKLFCSLRHIRKQNITETTWYGDVEVLQKEMIDFFRWDGDV